MDGATLQMIYVFTATGEDTTMSIKMMTMVMETQMSDPTGKFVLLVLADHYNDSEGNAWPSIGRIVDVTGMSRATVQRKLKDFERKGVIERTKRYNNSDIYTFNTHLLNGGYQRETSHSDNFEVSQCDTNPYEPLIIKKGNRKKTKLVDWSPSEDDKAHAKASGHDWQVIWQAIQDWNAVHDNTKAYLNCSQFFKNWCGREKPAKKQRGSYGKEANGSSYGRKTITKEMWDEAGEPIRKHWRLNRPREDWIHHEKV
jgi:DNA-binding Lrp family transcriptional regulator